MNPMMLVLAMSAGQGPATPPPAAPPGYQYPAVRTQSAGGIPAASVPVIPIPNSGTLGYPTPVRQAQQGTVLPTLPSIPMNAQTAQPAEPPPPPTDETPKEKEAEEPPATPPVYLLERSLRDTWLGKAMTDRNLRVYGWTAMSYTVGTTNVSNAPMYFNDRPNHFQMNQNWLHFEKSIDTSKAERQWGFVTDSILPGTDARTTLARGLFDGQLTQGPLSPNGAVPPAPIGTSVPYPFDLYQAYAQVFLPNFGGKGTTVKIGKFSTHCEYEVVQAVDTPFVSKSYLFEYNPFTHTGVYATTQVNDTWAISNGAVLGSDNFIDPANRFTYIGQIKWAPPEGKNTVLLNAVVTDPSFDVAEAFNFYNVYNLQWIHKFNDKASYVLDSTFSHMYNIPGVGSAVWYGAVNYFIYKHTDKLTSTFRAEAFDDNSGVRTGFAGLYTEFTYGVAWTPKPGLIIRPSVRYDHNADSAPFEGKSNMWTGAFEMIVRW